MEEALQARMRHIRAEIAGENPTPLEVLEVLEGLIAAQYRSDLKDRSLGPGLLMQQSRILESAIRRYLAAIRELARVRKLQATAPQVQMNSQINAKE